MSKTVNTEIKEKKSKLTNNKSRSPRKFREGQRIRACTNQQ